MHGPRPRVLGVVGTFVLDTIEGLPGLAAPIERLGGIAYSLAAAAHALPTGWMLRPIARVGSGAEEAVAGFLDRLEARLAEGDLDRSAIVAAEEPNNRVHLTYLNEQDRVERLTGGVGPWRWSDLARHVDACDALFVNFISGHELGLQEARKLRNTGAELLYADVHSLMLDTAPDGTRVPRALPDAEAWLRCFDAVQANTDEFALLGRSWRGIDADAPGASAIERLPADGPTLVVRTDGEDGARCWWIADAGDRWIARPSPKGGDRAVVSYQIPAEIVTSADPTGCGDVWGATMACALAGGRDVREAATRATRASSAAARGSGARVLLDLLAPRDDLGADPSTTNQRPVR